MANSISVAVDDSETIRRGCLAIVTVRPPGCPIVKGKCTLWALEGDGCAPPHEVSPNQMARGQPPIGPASFALAVGRCVCIDGPPAAPTTPGSETSPLE